MNRTASEASYELKGGPLRMTMSTCLLLPGEEEVWRSPYRVHQLDVACELHVEVDGVVRVIEVPEEAEVVIEPHGADFRLRVTGPAGPPR